MESWAEDRAQAGGLVDEVTMVIEYNRAVVDLAMEAAEVTPGVEYDRDCGVFAIDEDGFVMNPETGEYLLPDRIRRENTFVHIGGPAEVIDFSKRFDGPSSRRR